MATRRPRKFTVALDERTEGMTDAALECRTYNHKWDRVPQSPTVRRKLLAEGVAETRRVCSRCGARKTEVFDIYDGLATLSVKIEYPEGYLLDSRYKGTGRLPRHEAKKATVLAEYTEIGAELASFIPTQRTASQKVAA